MQDITTREMKAILKQNGFILVRSHGSHAIYKSDNRTVSIPVSDKVICGALARKLIKDIEN